MSTVAQRRIRKMAKEHLRRRLSVRAGEHVLSATDLSVYVVHRREAEKEIKKPWWRLLW